MFKASPAARSLFCLVLSMQPASADVVTDCGVLVARMIAGVRGAALLNHKTMDLIYD